MTAEIWQRSLQLSAANHIYQRDQDTRRHDADVGRHGEATHPAASLRRGRREAQRRKGAEMRRLDWFLAAIVAAFLIGAIAIEASAVSLGGAALMRPQAIDAGDVSLRRLVSHLPQSPVLPDGPR